MLLINLIRALLLLAGIGLYHIYNKEFMTYDQGMVVFVISFFGLILWEILEDYVVKAFNREAPTDSTSPRRLS